MTEASGKTLAIPSLRGLILSNRDYRYLWLSGAASNFGDFVFETTLVLWIATDLGTGKSWAAASTALWTRNRIGKLRVG